MEEADGDWCRGLKHETGDERILVQGVKVVSTSFEHAGWDISQDRRMQVPNVPGWPVAAE